MEIPDFSGLPDVFQGVLYTITALAIGVSIIVPRLGFLSGKANPPPATTNSPVFAAVVADPTALNNHGLKVEMLARSIDGLAKVIDDAREEMRVQNARRPTR